MPYDYTELLLLAIITSFTFELQTVRNYRMGHYGCTVLFLKKWLLLAFYRNYAEANYEAIGCRDDYIIIVSFNYLLGTVLLRWSSEQFTLLIADLTDSLKRRTASSSQL